ncbi:MAG: glycoside hydrolase family 15 protein [Pyrinomonadaceae bacterium]
MQRAIQIAIVSLLGCTVLCGQALAPGAPGLDAHWPSAAKNGFGTSHTLASKVWFTLNNGVLTEVFYPTLDVPNVQMLQFVFVSADGKRVETEAEDMEHELEVLDPAALTFRQISKGRRGDYTITKTYVTDPERSSILIDVQFHSAAKPLCFCRLYLYYDPSLNNSGMHDSGWIDGEWLVTSDADKTSALTVTKYVLDDSTSGYLGTSDGLTQLRRSGSVNPYIRADKGNVVQMARLRFPLGLPRSSERFTVVLSFGRNQREAIANGQASVRKDFEVAKAEYSQGWHEYVKSLPLVGEKYQPQFNMAAMVLKGLEDKTHRGAMIASPSNPWGGGANANEPMVSGYHAVWSRDLYHVATAFLALGDRAAANRALDYLFKVQQKPDGSFPQNSWVDGRPIGGGLQMDQVALPLVLAYQLERTDRRTWLKHIKPAAELIVSKGPATEQERWEEKRGYSPSTIAAQIAGLVCAAHFASINNDKLTGNRYLKRADEWLRQLESWTATTNGSHLKSSYYLRITEDPDPNDGDKIEINSGGGVYDEREIVDAGFLELVRLGIKPADDPLIVRTLNVIDKLIKAETPGGPGWYRYNHDAYGETANGGKYDGRTGIGRLWTLLTGERGEYDIANGSLSAARTKLNAMMSFANDGLMIPEQVWDRRESPRAELQFGKGTGSATPLAWSMAQFIRLSVNIKSKHNVETPRIVAERYSKRHQGRDGRFNEEQR